MKNPRAARVTLKSLGELWADTQRMVLRIDSAVMSMAVSARRAEEAERLPDVEAPEPRVNDLDNPDFFRGYARGLLDARRVEAGRDREVLPLVKHPPYMVPDEFREVD